MEEKEILNEEESEIIELIDEFGHKTQYYLLATMDYQNKTYAFFEPAEEIEGAEEGDVVIFEVVEKGDDGMLLPIEDEDLLQAIFDEFVKYYNEEEGEDNEDENSSNNAN